MMLLLDWSLKVSVIFSLALLAMPFMRRQPATLRHWVLSAAIICAALTPVMSAVLPPLNLHVRAGIVDRLQSSLTAGVVYEPSFLASESRDVEFETKNVRSLASQRDALLWLAPAVRQRIKRAAPSAIMRAEPETPASSSRQAGPGPRSATPSKPIDIAAVVRAIWFAGMFIGCAALVIGAGRLRRLASKSAPILEPAWLQISGHVSRDYRLKRTPQLLRSLRPSILATWGAMRPEILLPSGSADWSEEQIEIVLSHELAHIRRGDWLMQVLAEIVRTFYWFNPLAWMVCRSLDRESEHACDDAVLNRGIAGADYAAHLLALARTLHTARVWVPASMMARRRTLQRRFKSILDPLVNRRRATRLSLIGASASFLLLVLPLASFHVAAPAPAVKSIAAQPIVTVAPSAAPVQAPSERTALKTALATLAALLPEPAAQSNDGKDMQKAREEEEGGKALRQWLEEDVVYIITDEEKAAFKKLKTDEERYQFIEQFWLRRDPTPGTLENEFRDQHYARIAYANEHFASGIIPGWKTDRGRIYITFGPPDSIDEDMPTGGTYRRPASQGGGTTSTFPFVKWRYRYLENYRGINRQEVMFEFVDSSMSGEYRLAVSPNEKDALIHGPNAGLDLLGNYRSAFRPPEVQYKDLETVVTTKLSFNLLPFNIRTDFIRVFEEQVLTPITVSVLPKDLAFHEQDGFQSATGQIYGTIHTVSGRFVQKFEDGIAVGPWSTEIYKSALDKPQKYQKAIYLAPGLYNLRFVIKDVQSGNMGTTEMSFRVPRLADQTLASSSLIVADYVQNLPPRQVTGQFILGDKKVRPNLNEALQKDQDLHLWMQVYGLKVDPTSHKPSAEVEILITRSGREVKRIVEDSAELPGAAQQMTLVKSIPLKDFDPGAYEVKVKVTDKLSDGAVTVQSGTFSVR